MRRFCLESQEGTTCLTFGVNQSGVADLSIPSTSEDWPFECSPEEANQMGLDFEGIWARPGAPQVSSVRDQQAAISGLIDPTEVTNPGDLPATVVYTSVIDDAFLVDPGTAVNGTRLPVFIEDIFMVIFHDLQIVAPYTRSDLFVTSAAPGATLEFQNLYTRRPPDPELGPGTYVASAVVR